MSASSPTSKGMVQVFGTTYRIVQTASVHEVIRLLDDCCVGSFCCEPALTVVESRIAPELLREVALQALRSSRLEWRPRRSERKAARPIFWLFERA
jgi:hypothetical protein